MLAPQAQHSVELHALHNAAPLVVDLRALQQRLNDVAVDPVRSREALFLHVVREMVAALSPVGTEMAAEATAPACARHAAPFGG